MRGGGALCYVPDFDFDVFFNNKSLPKNKKYVEVCVT